MMIGIIDKYDGKSFYVIEKEWACLYAKNLSSTRKTVKKAKKRAGRRKLPGSSKNQKPSRHERHERIDSFKLAYKGAVVKHKYLSLVYSYSSNMA